MDDFSPCISNVDDSTADTAAVLSVRRQLEEALAKLEKDVSMQERRRLENVNELNMGQAQVAEMSDQLSKARMKEHILAEKVTAWVRYLQEERKKTLIKENRLCTGVSDELDENVNYHINLITEKRTAVENCVEETKERRQQHKNYLRMLKAELDELQKMIIEWDEQVKDISSVNENLVARRMQLEEQLVEKERKEKEEKTKYQELEREMERLVRKNSGAQMSLASFSNLQVSNSEAGSTTLAEGLLTDIRRLHNAFIRK